MRREKISQALEQIDFNFVQEALEKEEAARTNKQGFAARFWQFHRFAACACTALAIAAFSFTTAFAASESFRQAVISIFYPLYSDSEIKELEEGHRTGSFDLRDTLLTFLSRFNAEEMEAGISAKYEQGYVYVLVENSAVPEGSLESILAVVESSREDYRLLITMEKKPYEESAGIWQVVSYQVVSAKRAGEILSEMPVYVPEE